MHTLDSIIAEFEARNYRCRARCLREIRDKLERDLCFMGKIANAFDVKNKRIAQLEAELKNCVPVDSSDLAALSSVDDDGNSVPQTPAEPTEEELTAQLKQSADALNESVEANRS